MEVRARVRKAMEVKVRKVRVKSVHLPLVLPAAMVRSCLANSSSLDNAQGLQSSAGIHTPGQPRKRISCWIRSNHAARHHQDKGPCPHGARGTRTWGDACRMAHDPAAKGRDAAPAKADPKAKAKAKAAPQQ